MDTDRLTASLLAWLAFAGLLWLAFADAADLLVSYTTLACQWQKAARATPQRLDYESQTQPSSRKRAQTNR